MPLFRGEASAAQVAVKKYLAPPDRPSAHAAAGETFVCHGENFDMLGYIPRGQNAESAK